MARKATSRKGRRRNATPTTDEHRGFYPARTYVGSIVAPKVMMPVSVYANADNDDRFRLFTPDRKLSVGAGYYGDQGPGGCIRQHMLPGLEDKSDIGTGLGTTLYVGGNMVVAAAIQNANRKFPWRIDASSECTFSVEGDRSADAERAWANLVRHRLAVEDETEGDEEEIEESYDIDYFVSERDIVNEAEERFEREHDVPGSAYVELTDQVSVTGTRSESITANFMNWDTIKNSRLILHLGPYFDDPDDFEPIPPGVFARIDWSHTPDDLFVKFARANAEGDLEDWILEAACLIGGIGGLDDLSQRGTHLAQLLLKQVNATRPRNPCPIKYASETRAWMRRYGDAYAETNPRQRAIARRIANPGR